MSRNYFRIGQIGRERLILQVRAVQRVGFPCAALVNQNDVALFQHVFEEAQDGTIGLGGRLSRSTGQQEQWVRLRFAAGCGDDGDAQIDRASCGRRAILKDCQDTTAGIDATFQTARFQTHYGCRLHGRRLRAARDRKKGEKYRQDEQVFHEQRRSPGPDIDHFYT